MSARERRQQREADEYAAEHDAQRAADARRRPVAAALVATLESAIRARVRDLPIDRIATRDWALEMLDRERDSALALLEGGACAPDLTETEARAALVRCGLIPAAGPDQPGSSTDVVTAVAGAPDDGSGAPVPPRCGCGRAVAVEHGRCAACAEAFARARGGTPVAEPIRWTGAPIARRCSRCQVRAAETAGMCRDCSDEDSADLARECRGDAVITAGGGDPIRCQSPEQDETVAAALNAYQGATAAAETADPTKAEVEIRGRRVALYLVCGPDGRERWISEPQTPPAGPFGAYGRERAGWQGTAYCVALIAPRWTEDGAEGRAVPLGTIAARHRKHAADRARGLGASLW